MEYEILEQERQLKEDQNASSLERLQKIEKRLRYAELRKEIFMTKQLELQERIEKWKSSKASYNFVRSQSEIGVASRAEEKKNKAKEMKS